MLYFVEVILLLEVCLILDMLDESIILFLFIVNKVVLKFCLNLKGK